MSNKPRQSDVSEVEPQMPPGVLDLMALYERAEEVYIQAAAVSSTLEVQVVTGNSTNMAVRRGQ